MKIEIRPAEMIDAEAICGLYVSEGMHPQFADRENIIRQNFEKQLGKKEHFWLVAMYKNMIVGVLHAREMQWLSNLKPYLYVQMLVVIPLLRKQGIGTKIMQYLENIACERYVAICLDSSMERTPAHSFYSQLEYENEGVFFTKML